MSYNLSIIDDKGAVVKTSNRISCEKDAYALIGDFLINDCEINDPFEIKISHLEEADKVKYMFFLDYLDECISIGDYLLIFKLGNRLYKVIPGIQEE